MCIGIAKYCESVMKDSAKKSEYSEVDQSDEIVINVKEPKKIRQLPVDKEKLLVVGHANLQDEVPKPTRLWQGEVSCHFSVASNLCWKNHFGNMCDKQGKKQF